MRLLKLLLKAVGPFSEVELDLSGGQYGLHLIHGPNEAGKTSTLRALSHLLFGFPSRTNDNFIYPYDQLRVGGTIRHSDGEELEFVRRKALRNTLRAADDQTVIEPERLARFLGGVDQETFENLFGIDHARLSQAGEELRKGEGKLGELLFAAGTGLAGLGQAKQRLQEQLDQLFKPRGQNPRINQALSEFRGIQDEIKTYQLPSEEWMRHDAALAQARATSDRLVEQSRAARKTLNRMTRVRDAIPQVARLRRLQNEMRAFDGVVRLRDSFGAEVREAQDALQRVATTVEKSHFTLQELDVEIASTQVRHDILEAGPAIETLSERLGAVEKALSDRPRLEGWRLEKEHQAREILHKLGRDRDLERASELRLRSDEPPLIRSLGQRFTALRVQREETRAAIAKSEAQMSRIEQERSQLGSPRDVSGLRRAIQVARRRGDLDSQYSQARTSRDRALRQADLERQRLFGWTGTLEDLECQAVPPDPALDRYESRWLTLEQDLRRLTEQQATEDDAIKHLEVQIKALDLHQDVPTEEDLRAVRQRRDEGWRWLRDGQAPLRSNDPEVVRFIAEFAPGRSLPDAFEQCMARADAMGDRLRHEADRVARKAEWLAQLQTHKTASLECEHARARVEASRNEWRVEWTQLVGALGIEVPHPVELRAWLRAREQVVQLATRARDASAECAELERLIADHLTALRLELQALGVSPSDAEAELAVWLDRAESVLEQEEQVVRRHEALGRRWETVKDDLARDRGRLQATEEELHDWNERWTAKMARIGLGPDATPEQAEVVLSEIQELFEALGKRRDHLSRIKGIDRDAEQFGEEVGAIAKQLGLALDTTSASVRARELARAYQAMRELSKKAATLIEQRDREHARLREAETDRVTLTSRLDRLCQEAGCDQTEDLADAERQSRDAARLEQELRSCEEQLHHLAPGADVEAFAVEVEQADADELGFAMTQRESEIAALEAELLLVNVTIGEEQAELNRMDGSDRAAESAEKAQTIVTRLQADVAQYARLKLAAAVLNRGIERYRERSQGPVLTRASQLFSDLTGGSFARLQIDDDGGGRTELKGVRQDGKQVSVEGMSDGSHDQLYLALRLASLESWLGSHEPIPFIVDDILLNFDDQRSLAALKALAALSRKTQVLFFTHHEHLLNLAREHLPPDLLFAQSLPTASARQNGRS